MQTEAGVQQIEFVYNPMGQRVLKIVKDYVSGSYNESASNSWRYTYYTYDANGQVMATYDLINNTVTNVKTATLDEQMLYGMSRLGVKSNAMTIYTNQQSLAPESSTWQNKVGKKNYELTNHLGNVNVVITDRKVVNTNYVVNTFTSSTNSWSACTNASLATGATAMTVTSTGASNNCTYKVFTTTANTPYAVRVKSAKGTVSAGLRVSIWGGATLLKQVPLADNDFSHVVFTANGANVTIILEPISGNGVYTVDEVSLTPNSIYEAVSVMKADYYPYGMDNLSRNEVFGMPGRVTNSGAYRYAYNGMEVDPETKGNGNSYTTEFRQYDPRLGRWLSLDPLMAKYPDMSPYCAFNNNPVFYTDPEGLEGVNATGDGGKKNKDKRVGGQSGSGLLAASVFGLKLGNITHLEEHIVTADAPRDKNGKRIKFKSREPNLGSQPSDRLGTNDYGVAREVQGYLDAPGPMPVIPEISDGSHISIRHAKETGRIYKDVFELIPGVTIIKKLESGEEWTTDEIIVEGISFIPGGKLFTKGGRLFAWAVKKGGGKKAVDITDKAIKQACFTAGTKISTETGLKNIEEIVIGDQVWAFDAATGESSVKEVLETFLFDIDHLQVIYINTDTIYTTDDHPFFVNSSWIEAKDLKPGDSLVQFKGTKLPILKIDRIDTLVTVYNFEVADFHTYFVGDEGILVHNKPKPIKKINKAVGFPKIFDETLEEIKNGLGVPRIDPATGQQAIFQGRNMGAKQKALWEGAVEWDVPGTSHRILEKTLPNGTVIYGRIVNHDYLHPHIFK